MCSNRLLLAKVTNKGVSSAEMKRIHRLMSPREDGSYLVPQEVVKMWKDLAEGGREEVKKLWLNVGGNKDRY